MVVVKFLFLVEDEFVDDGENGGWDVPFRQEIGETELYQVNIGDPT